MSALLASSVTPSRRKPAASIVARDALAEMALDLAITAEIVADAAPRASLDRLEKAILALRAGVLSIGMTFREIEAAEKREAA